MAVNLEGFAELDVGTGDDFLQFDLAPVERQFPEVATVQVQKIEGDQEPEGQPRKLVA
jgi:hypothetical protein